MKPSEALIAARTLITPVEKWTKGALARDIKGNEVNMHDTSSVCWCAAGAIHKVVSTYEGNKPNKKFLELRKYLIKAMDSNLIVTYNDTHTHEEVLNMFDKGISLAQNEGN